MYDENVKKSYKNTKTQKIYFLLYYYMKFIIQEIRNYKVIFVILSMIFFSFVYMFVSDDEWHGANKMVDIVKEEAVREKVDDIESHTKEIVDFQNVEGFVDFSKLFTTNMEKSDSDAEIILEIESAEREADKEKLIKSPFETYFNRLYFSIVTGCLLGYGDIYPESMRLKAVVIAQALLTIIIIVL